MTNKNMRGFLAAAIILVLYNLVVFLLPFDRDTIFYIAYGFTLAAFVIACVAVYNAFKKPAVKSKFYGFPVARIALIYLAVQLVLGLVFMIIGENVEVISPSAFMGCTTIERLTISKNVRKIGEEAFMNCEYMADIYSNIPAEFLFEISQSVFEYVNKETCNLHVPHNSKTKYRTTKYWNESS